MSFSFKVFCSFSESNFFFLSALGLLEVDGATLATSSSPSESVFFSSFSLPEDTSEFSSGRLGKVVGPSTQVELALISKLGVNDSVKKVCIDLKDFDVDSLTSDVFDLFRLEVHVLLELISMVM